MSLDVERVLLSTGILVLWSIAAAALAIRVCVGEHVAPGMSIEPGAAAIASVALVTYFLGPGHEAFSIGLMMSTLIACVWTDLRTNYVADILIVPTFGALIGIAFFHGVLFDAIGGAVIVALPLATLSLVTSGNVGWGDSKLALCVGTALGWDKALLAIALSFIAGGIIAVVYLAIGKSRKTQVPFAPFLASGALMAIFLDAPLQQLVTAWRGL